MTGKAFVTGLLSVVLVTCGLIGCGTGGGGAISGEDLGIPLLPGDGSGGADQTGDQGEADGGGGDASGPDGGDAGDTDGSNDDATEGDETADNDSSDDAEPPPTESDFELTSRSLLDNQGFIDRRFAWAACGGNNTSPQLSWTGAPAGTQSFVVVIFDEDAGAFIHWIVFDIAASVGQIPEGGQVPGGQTLNDFDQGQFGYGGPCPPSGETHTYVFRIYALDVRHVGLTAGQATSLTELVTLLNGTLLDQTEFTAEYANP